MGEMNKDMDAIVEILARELGQQAEYVKNVVQLLDEGNTIPFIARYRKELHGAMDDTTLRNLETKLRYLRSLQERREEVLRAMESQGKLTPALRRAVEAAGTLAEVEDLYRPYRPKRRTRATVAREKGLEPLAAELFRQDGRAPTLLAKGYINPELGVETVEEALAGASDILAEEISDDAAIRKDLRQLMARRAVLTSRAASPETDSVYRLYYDFSCPAAQLQGHQILALNRGEKEGFLKLSLDLPGAQGAALVCRHALKPQKTVSAFVKAAAEDAYARLIAPAAERELRNDLTGRKQLLKVPKLGPKAFQQCAGFLRVPESRELLDHTGVHPESYPAAEQLLQLLGLRKGEALTGLCQKVDALGWEEAASACGVGVPTLRDMARELEKPGRDPRQELPAPLLRRDVMAIRDLKPGMVLTGTVRNVIDFGAFVDIGVHQDGLVHISQVTNRFIRHPSEVVHVGDVVQVAVLEVDEKRGRISLTMKNLPKEARS